jgi:hypothetical protein
MVRELDERCGFSELIAQHLTDFRGKNAQLGFADLLRQSVYSRLAGYEDLNNAERLSRDQPFGSSVPKRSRIKAPLLPHGCRVLSMRCWPRTRTSTGWRASAGH